MTMKRRPGYENTQTPIGWAPARPTVYQLNYTWYTYIGSHVHEIIEIDDMSKLGPSATRKSDLVSVETVAPKPRYPTDRLRTSNPIRVGGAQIAVCVALGLFTEHKGAGGERKCARGGFISLPG